MAHATIVAVDESIGGRLILARIVTTFAFQYVLMGVTAVVAAIVLLYVCLLPGAISYYSP